MSDEEEDVVVKAGARCGMHLESRPVDPLLQIVATGIGSLAGSMLGGALGMGGIGRALSSIGGAVAGHIAVTYRRVEAPAPAPAAPPSPAAVSDRR